MNEKDCAELIVIMPSYGPPTPMVPLANIAGGVLRPTALPLALERRMLVDNAIDGRLAFAVVSLAVLASPRRAFM